MLIRSTVLAAVAVLGFAASVVSAQNYIRVDVVGVVTAGDSFTANIDFSVVLDTTAGPTDSSEGTISFDVLNARAVDPATHTSDSPMYLSEPPAPIPVTGTFRYINFTDEYNIQLNTPSGSILLGVTPPRGEFSLSMTSLPDDPADYLVDSTDSGATVGLIGPSGDTRWNPGFPTGDDGGFRVIVRSVDDPSLDECEADFTGDGNLNFLDVSAFLTLFSAGCP